MFGFISIPLILQIICLYHAYKNHKETHLIRNFVENIIVSLMYLFTQVLKGSDIEKAQGAFEQVVLPGKKIKALKQELEFSNTHDNNIKLADAFFDIKDFKSAVKYYENSLDGLFTEDEYTHRELVKAYYQLGNYNAAIQKGNVVSDDNDFKKSDGYYFYGLALLNDGQTEPGSKIFSYIDKPFSNYAERLNYAIYLIENESAEKGYQILNTLLNESQRVSKDVKRKNSLIFKEVKNRIDTK